MARKFNITGICIPQEHFMADMSKKLDQIMDMVTNGDYFTIHRPRQYGKTTIMYLLGERLKQDPDYLVLDISFEGIDSPTYESHQRFIKTYLNLMCRELQFLKEDVLVGLINGNLHGILDFDQLNGFLAKLISSAGRKIVLMIDEVDKSGNNQLFLDFLGMLRTKFLNKKKGKDLTFHSVILAGVHDIKSLKARMRPAEEKLYNSPWNIAVDFDVDISLFPDEIASMLELYSKEKEVDVDIPYFSEQLYYYTSGYPFLVSYLCKMIDEQVLPAKKINKNIWEADDLLKALHLVLQKGNPNFGSLIKNLENNPDLYDFVFDIIMNEKVFAFNQDNPLIQSGIMYGIIFNDTKQLKVHNRLYEQRIYNYLASKMETLKELRFDHSSHSFLKENDSLNIKKIIEKFQDFMKEQYSSKDKSFLERNGRLLFLAFLRPILNGRGFDFKEVQISEEKRLDIVITFGPHIYIIELKIWRGDSYHQKGLVQFCDYLNLQNQTSGYLLIFDLRRESNRIGESERIQVQDKHIFAAWV
jgi:hypothetical protein